MPIAVKDDIDVAGEVTAFGTNAAGEPARADAEVVRRLREAGAVIIGKTNVPELTLWPFTETATFGATRNPWDLQRAPGGSSGGSAAAVAAGLVGAALGSDGAGSIRIPAAWCGLFGLKPQRGRVSMAPRATRLARPVGQRRADAQRWPTRALFHDVASGAIEIDADRAPAPDGPVRAGRRARAPGRLRIAYSTRVPLGVISEPRRRRRAARCEETVELLRSLGHEVSRARPRLRRRTRCLAVTRALPARRPRRRGRAGAPRAPGTAHARDGAARRADPAGAAASARSPARPSSRAG